MGTVTSDCTEESWEAGRNEAGVYQHHCRECPFWGHGSRCGAGGSSLEKQAEKEGH